VLFPKKETYPMDCSLGGGNGLDDGWSLGMPHGCLYSSGCALVNTLPLPIFGNKIHQQPIPEEFINMFHSSSSYLKKRELGKQLNRLKKGKGSIEKQINSIEKEMKNHI